MSNERMQAAIKELQDIEKRQSEVLKDLNEFRIRSEKNQDRIETNLAEITEQAQWTDRLHGRSAATIRRHATPSRRASCFR
jgi:hypothetical protein